MSSPPPSGATTRLTMDFRILGPLEVRDRGRPIALPRRKQRAVLAILLLRRGEAVSSDVLVDALWAEDPPPTARAALHNYVAQLRRALGPGLVLSRAGSYLLDIVPEQIDVGRFERLTAEGRAASGEERVEKLREALMLWRGPPLADLAFEPFAANEASRLEELRTAALEELIDAKLSLGASAELVAELEALITEHPFRERLRGQLMLALYRAGRQAEALDAYQEARRTLTDELGIEPSAPLRELEQALLRQDPSVAAPVRVATEMAAPQEERRKTVTVLFADVAYPVTLDPELLRETSLAVLNTMRDVLEGHGAMIEQRSGDEVMAVFGVPRSHEDDALRAARAATELQTEIAALVDVHEPDRKEGVDLRVAIETGEVLAGADEAGHGFIAGPAITLARRLLQRARSDEILAGPATLRLLGDAIVIEPIGREGSRVLEVVEGAPQLPRHFEAPLVGRGAELATLHQNFARVVDERSCRLVLILGEAGIGKTRLASELTTELNGDATVLVGRCASYGKGATYLPLAEIISQVRTRSELRELLAGDEHAELIGARLAGLTGEEGGSGSGGETFWAVRRLFEALAGERPVVLLFEDLHWAEPTLLDLIDYLAERISDAPILLLGLARPELLDERSEWVETEMTRLAPLSSEDGEQVIENLGEVPAELRAQIVHTAGGNPLFLEQLLAHAVEDGEPKTLPPSLEALLASRLDHLEPGELSVVQRAAVAGREFSRKAVVHLLLDQEAASVGAQLLALVRKGLIRESRPEPAREDKFRFQHVLIRDAAYATLPKARRAELHERFGRWLEADQNGSDELIGFHFERAFLYMAELGPVDVEATRRLATDAGGRLGAAGLRAAKSGDTHAASNLLTRASSLLDAREIARRDLLTELGLVVWRGGDLKLVEDTFGQALEAAVSEHDQRAQLRARLELAYLRLFRAPEGGVDELLSLAAEAMPVLEQLRDDRTLGRVWYVLAHVHGGFRCRYRQSADAAERALFYFRRSNWPVAPCLQELAAGLYCGPTNVEEGIRRCRALLDEADRGGEANILVFLAGLEAMAERFDSARDLAGRARKIYEELVWTDKISANYAAVAADIEMLAGDYPEAERLLSASCDRLEAWGEQARLATQAAQLGEALYWQGRFEEALRWSQVAEDCAATDDASAQFSWRALQAKALARRGAFSEAHALARKAVEIGAATDALTQHAQVLLAFAEVLRLEGHGQEAGEAIEDAIRLLERKGNIVASRKARSSLLELARA
jgi:DNA-binding SARP family transcriptional activator